MIGDAPSATEQKYFELSKSIVEEAGYELYDVEYIKGSKTLRVYIADKESGTAQIEDCVAVDRAFTEPVEAAEWIPDDFVLEVSSPGVYRNLKTEKHFEDAEGDSISVTLRKELIKEGLPKKLKGQKKIRGVLKSSNKEKIILDADGIDLEIEVGNVRKANLDPDL